MATHETPTTPQVIFTVDEPLYIVPPKLTDLRTAEEFSVNWLDRVQTFVAFTLIHPPSSVPPSIWVSMLPSGCATTFCACTSQASGHRGQDKTQITPPLVWEVSIGGGGSHEIRPSRSEGDATARQLQLQQGSITFYLPDETAADFFMGLERTWIRCRSTRKDTQGTYSRSPRIRQVRVESWARRSWRRTLSMPNRRFWV